MWLTRADSRTPRCTCLFVSIVVFAPTFFGGMRIFVVGPHHAYAPPFAESSAACQLPVPTKPGILQNEGS